MIYLPPENAAAPARIRSGLKKDYEEDFKTALLRARGADLRAVRESIARETRH